MSPHFVAGSVRVLASVSILSLTSLAGCAGDSATEPKTDPYQAALGGYLLDAVNGASLPYTITKLGEDFEVTWGRYELKADRSYELVMQHLWRGQYYPGVEHGTYVLVGTQITFSVPPVEGYGGFTYSGSMSGSALTITSEGHTYLFKKQ